MYEQSDQINYKAQNHSGLSYSIGATLANIWMQYSNEEEEVQHVLLWFKPL